MDQSSQPPLPVLDREGTLQRLKGDISFLHILYGVFADDLPTKLAALDQALAQGDMPLLQRTAHSLKGASATVGAPLLREAAFAMEAAGREADPARAAAIMPGLRDSAEMTQAAIAAIQEES